MSFSSFGLKRNGKTIVQKFRRGVITINFTFREDFDIGRCLCFT